MESLINHDAVPKRELYKSYKFDILKALSKDVHLIHYPLTKILCFELINYCTTADSTYKDQEEFNFDVFSKEENLNVKLKTLRDLKVSNQYLDESNLFFSKLFSKIDENEQKVITIDQGKLREVLDTIKREHHSIITNDVAVEIKSPIGTAQSSFKYAICGSTKNFFSDMRADSVSDILAQI